MANDLSAFNSEAWASLLVKKLDQTNIMLPLVNRNWEGDLRQNKTVWVRTPGNIAMATYTRGTPISYQDLTPTKEAFTVNDGAYFAFDVDDIDKAQSDINAMDVYTARAVVTMGNRVETKILSTYTSVPIGNRIGAAVAGSGATFTVALSDGGVATVTVTNGGSGYSSAPVVGFIGGNGNGATAHASVRGGAITDITVDAAGNNYTIAPSIRLSSATPVVLDSTTDLNTGVYNVFARAKAILTKNNVPQEGRWAVVDPDTTTLLLNDTAHFIRAGDLGDRIVQSGQMNGEPYSRNAAEAPGFIGMILGFMVYETPHIPTAAVGSPVVPAKYLLFGDNQAISYASQITEIEALRLQTTFANAIRGLLLHDTFVSAESGKRLVYCVASDAAAA